MESYKHIVVFDKLLLVGEYGTVKIEIANGQYRTIKAFRSTDSRFLFVKIDRKPFPLAELVALAWLPKRSTDVALRFLDGCSMNVCKWNLSWR
jgi:hypothetical protein